MRCTAKAFLWVIATNDKRDVDRCFRLVMGCPITSFRIQAVANLKRCAPAKQWNERDIKNTVSVGAEVAQTICADQHCKEACPTRKLKAY